MYCKKCGNEISDGAKFCKFCGAVQETQAAGSFQKPQNVDPVKEAEQQRQRERLDQQIVSLESERKAGGKENQGRSAKIESESGAASNGLAAEKVSELRRNGSRSKILSQMRL